MEREVVKNLAVDAKLFLHLSLLRLGTFRHRNFCIVRKATVQIWVTLRSQEGSHEKSVSYPERCPFSKFNRTFHRCSGQLSACRRSWLGKLPHGRWCAPATADSATPEADARLKAPGFGCIAELRSFQSVYLFYCEYWGSG